MMDLAATIGSLARWRGERVVVAMSGGVDSSVAALLLKRAGADVTGMMLRLWAPDDEAAEFENRCCSVEAVGDARRVADALDVPFHLINVRDEFKRVVVDAWADAYVAGETPNPCVTCNQRIRFSTLLKKAGAIDHDWLATGHYARIDRADDGSARLRQGVDPAKDQSYVLHALSQAQVRRLVFPLGELTKPQVRAIAADHGLPVASKHDSQEICFVPGKDYRQFLRDVRPLAFQPGDIVDAGGRQLGRHTGLADYTIGQRKGLGLGGGRPLFVLRLDAPTNRLVVGDEADLCAAALLAENVTFIAGQPLGTPRRALAKLRYKAPAAPATVWPSEIDADSGLALTRVEFDEPQRSITPGQSVVFIDGDEILGGGRIVRPVESRAPIGGGGG